MKKISQLTTDEATDYLCEITPYIANISADEALLNTLKEKMGNSEQASRAEIFNFGAAKISKLVPILLKDHRADVYGVLSVASGVSVDDIGKQNIMETMAQIKELISDKELVNFFNASSTTEDAE